MIHELKQIIQAYQARKESISAAMATVVALEGSSYRRPGVRMLILSDNTMIGAVSGGCVEKEIRRQSEAVFKKGESRMMIYDGRYRLGCEGILYILIEPFEPDEKFIASFWQCMQSRSEIGARSYFIKEYGAFNGLGTQFYMENKWYNSRTGFKPEADLALFEDKMKTSHQLIIIGAEHDAVQLCHYATLTGWEVTIVASASEEKSISDFPGAHDLLAIDADGLDLSIIDDQTSVILMTHSYVKDLSFLLKLADASPRYLGILGPESRREKLLNEFLERKPDANLDFMDKIHGPAGLDIGAETPQEIAISVISEILSVYRQSTLGYLKDKRGSIHKT